MSDVLTAEQEAIERLVDIAAHLDFVSPTPSSIAADLHTVLADHRALITENIHLTAALARCVEALEAMGHCLSVDETRLGMLMINGTKTASEVPEQAERVERIKVAWALRKAALASPEVAALAAKGGTQ